MFARTSILLSSALFVAVPSALAQSATTDTPPQEAFAPAAMEHTVTTPDQLSWQPAPSSLPPGAQVAVMRGDPTAASGTFAMRVKVPAGYSVPPHWHPTNENLTVVSGSMLQSMEPQGGKASAKLLPAGSYVYLPAKQPHQVWAGDQGFVLEIQAQAPFDLTYVNPGDDPRRQQAEAR